MSQPYPPPLNEALAPPQVARAIQRARAQLAQRVCAPHAMARRAKGPTWPPLWLRGAGPRGLQHRGRRAAEGRQVWAVREGCARDRRWRARSHSASEFAHPLCGIRRLGGGASHSPRAAPSPRDDATGA